MASTSADSTSPKVAGDLSVADLRNALLAGWRDFLAAPVYGLFFGAIYALAGALAAYAMIVRGELVWLIPLTAGFPLIAPFAAVGLYEVSRRRERGMPLGWRGVLGALRGRGDEQFLLMGGFVFVAFSFWVIIAHVIFSIFMTQSGVGREPLAALLTPEGLTMLAVGTAFGAGLAWAFYCVTVMSLPMLLDRDVDFITAIIASVKAVQQNPVIMLAWASLVAVTLFAAMLPIFLGLLVALPVLGHATWHLYRRTVIGSA
ncbi:DUF2189 domain-containing protein [Aurantiacibacter poecillastricola]|uniref:DUF2189 domain-containing protein n=1 Tax=Aurantiacibacter poecillastricola TaxID=3064385 RepID=UPI00273D47AA|nr:DUF2189 domain-containing protein [Aurantiacibacter sp. 219JJ12-13]MDP5261030.1 DUF2189 domain-containing protein [Aurantiacibacter sp. 219JJ12-13]